MLTEQSQHNGFEIVRVECAEGSAVHVLLTETPETAASLWTHTLNETGRKA
jgi:hypothetical protein